MNYNTVKGYIFVILSSLILVTAVFTTILQGGLKANFSFFGWPEGGVMVGVEGGVNTGLLMLFSGVGGIISYLCMHMLFSGIGSARKGREESARRTGTKLSDLNK